MATEEIEGVWTRWLSGAPVTVAEQERLVARLRADPPARERLQTDLRMAGALRALLAGTEAADGAAFAGAILRRLDAEQTTAQFTAAVLARLATRPPRRRVQLLSAVMVLVLAAAAVVLATRPWLAARRPPAAAAGPGPDDRPSTAVSSSTAPPVRPLARATVSHTWGRSYLFAGSETHAARRGDTIDETAVASTAADSSLRIALPDGSELELGASTTIAALSYTAARGTAAFVAAGAVHAATGDGVSVRLTTAHGVAAARDARFSVTVTAASARMSVAEGLARVERRGGDPVVIEAGRQAVIAGESGVVTGPVTPGGLALLLVGDPNLRPGDAAIRARLRQLGFEVRVALCDDPGIDNIKYASLILVSSTIESNDVGPQLAALRDARVPLITWEIGAMDDLAMVGTARADSGLDARSDGVLVVRDSSHLLSAGLAATVRVFESPPGRLHWAVPGPFAAWALVYPGEPPRAGVFGYEHGSPMIGRSAPARRVGLFLDDMTAAGLSADGWALFDAAVRWCVDPTANTEGSKR